MSKGENMNNISGFDCDGVCSIGIYPGPDDVIITGRSVEERIETLEFLESKGILNTVYFNPLPYDKKTRESSGIHKGNTIRQLAKDGIVLEKFFEDDLVQITQIRKIVPWIKIIHINHNGLIEMENVRRDADGNEV